MSNTWQEFNDANEPDVGDEIVVIMDNGDVHSSKYSGGGKLGFSHRSEILQWIHRPKPAIREFDIKVDGVRVQYGKPGLWVNGHGCSPPITKLVLKLLENR